jgi:hypothetical protein
MKFPIKAIKSIKESVKIIFGQIDWPLLVFLLLFMNVKLYIKVIAILFIYSFRFNFNFGFKFRNSRLPLFYVAVMIISFFNLILYRLYPDFHYDLVFLTGLFFWLLCILAIHQLKLSVDTVKPHILNNTLVIFFMINALVSIINIAVIIAETGALNPFLYQGLFQKYFIGTGDYVRGIFFDTSTTNALINAFGLVFFLTRKRLIMALVCTVILLLTGSNSTNFLLIIVLIYLFIFQSTRNQKSIISICFFLLILFLAKVSPQNNNYVLGMIKRDFSRVERLPVPPISSMPSITKLETDLRHKEQQIAESFMDSVKKNSQNQIQPVSGLLNIADPFWRPTLPQPDINSREYQSSQDTSNILRELLQYIKKQNMDSLVWGRKYNWDNQAGKLIAMHQTIGFFQQNPSKLLTGTGIGNFSSKLAFRATALKIAGGYPAKFQYISQGFRLNHFALFLYYFTKPVESHSIVNTPDSVYDQLIGEYGITGLIAFFFLYIGFFTKLIKRHTYAIPLLILLMGAFCLGYWFEQLSIVLIFELLLLIDPKTDYSATVPVNHITR